MSQQPKGNSEGVASRKAFPIVGQRLFNQSKIIRHGCFADFLPVAQGVCKGTRSMVFFGLGCRRKMVSHLLLESLQDSKGRQLRRAAQSLQGASHSFVRPNGRVVRGRLC